MILLTADSAILTITNVALTISAGTAFSLLIFSCLWCFKSKKPLDEEEEKTQNDQEKQHINKSINSQYETGNKRNLWGNLRNWFSKSPESNTGSSMQTQCVQGKQSLYDKPSILVNLVQPQPQLSPSTSKERGSLISIGHPPAVEKTRLSASEYIPEGFEVPVAPSVQLPIVDVPKENLGRIQFTTIYLFAENALHVKIIKGIGLKSMDLGGASDPFVKCCLLPDKNRKLETKVRRRTLNPIWNEVMSFEGLTYEKMKRRVLYLQVLDYDRFSRNDPIGQLHIPLHMINLGEEIRHDYPLLPCDGSNKRGQLQISLQYQAIKGILDIIILKGRNLKPMDINGKSDPYVKVWLIYRGRKVQKRKTMIQHKTLNPIFNARFQFDIPMGHLRDVQLEISVMDYDTLGRNDTIGKIYLGHKSTGLEKQHWISMLADPKKPVIQYHILKI